MSVQAGSWARAVGKVLNQGKPLRQSVLNELADHANADGHCWPSIKRIAENTCMSYTSVKRQLAELEAVGLLVRQRMRSGSGQLGRYEFWLMVHQQPLLDGPAEAPGTTQGRGHSDQGPQRAVVTQSPTRDHTEPEPGTTVVPQEPSGEPPREPSGGSPRAPAREAPVDNSGPRILRWQNHRIDLSEAPDGLSDQVVVDWLGWRRNDHRPPKPCTQHVVSRAMRELAKAVERGWSADEALTAVMAAGWSEPVADWLDNRFAERGNGGGGGADEGAVAEAWQRLQRHCRDGHRIDEVELEDPALARVARDLGGMSHLRGLTEREIGFLERKFRSMYAAELQGRPVAATGG